MLVGIESSSKSQLVHSLSVVVLVPEERQHDHRLPKMQRLRNGVVAAVCDHDVYLGQDHRLSQELLAGHVRSQAKLFVLRPHADDDEVISLCESVDQLLHEADVSRAKAPEAEVDDRLTVRGE